MRNESFVEAKPVDAVGQKLLEAIIERELERQNKWALIRVALWLMSAAIFGFIVGWSLPW